MAQLRIEESGRTIPVSPAISLLNLMLREGIAHPHVCGGRAECGTCRIRIVDGARFLSPMGERERKRLEATGAPEGTRLACQTFAFGDVTVRLVES